MVKCRGSYCESLQRIEVIKEEIALGVTPRFPSLKARATIPIRMDPATT